MEFKGIIPEVKMSEATLSFEGILEKLKPYDVVSVNTCSLFNGDLSLLRLTRKKYPNKFLIRKDFIMIPRQIKESKNNGADAVLLLRKYLTEKQYMELVKICREQKIIPLTEVQGEMQPSVGSLVMINSRDLNEKTFNKEKAEELCRYYKRCGFNVIYASGENSDRVIKEGIADAVLIGTSFVKLNSPNKPKTK